jgi:hypothetical protein
MANPNVFAQFAQPVKSVTDYQNDYAQADALKTKNALQSLALQQQQAATAQSLGERNALQQIAAQSGGDRGALIAGLRNSGLPGLMTQADSLEKSGADLQTAQSVAAKNTADAAKTTQGTKQTNYTEAMQKVLSFQSPQDAAASLSAAVQGGRIDMQHASLLLNSMPKDDPTAFDAWKRQWAIGITDPQKMADFLKPHIQTMNTGGAQVTQAVDPITLKPTTLSTVQNTVSPDTLANNQTSRANNAANIAKDYKVAGLDGQGNFAAVPGAPGAPGAAGTPVSQVQQLGDAIGKYQGAESTVLSRVPPALKGQVLAYVSQTYPDYNPSTYDARTKAARDFTSGSQGNALRSFAVAGQHLDQLGTLVDALDNGNVQIINKIGNQIGSQMGSTAPTNFDAAKDVVSKEVTKAIVAGGGGVAERAELAEQMSNAKTPAQLKGVISQYRNLMSAQHDALVQQRQAAGLPDSTLPAYSKGDVMAPGVFKITHVDGKPQ